MRDSRDVQVLYLVNFVVKAASLNAALQNLLARLILTFLRIIEAHMSDRLAISATLSVLTMAIYVLLATDAAQAPFSGDRLSSPISVTAPEISLEASELLPQPR
jgi:hypothetical protein